MSAGRASVGCGGEAGVGGPGLISAIGWVGTAGAEIARGQENLQDRKSVV